MKQARFIQIIEMQNVLYTLDEEGKVWRYAEDSTAGGHAWMPLSSRRHEEPALEPPPTVGFRTGGSRKG